MWRRGRGRRLLGCVFIQPPDNTRRRMDGCGYHHESFGERGSHQLGCHHGSAGQQERDCSETVAEGAHLRDVVLKRNGSGTKQVISAKKCCWEITSIRYPQWS